jgi:serine phosphatase RsbU (regulator of sigma subunit)
VLNEISNHHFVLMKPCELVSGDFFWATILNEFKIFCVADCTGHGVPGAFMSILGITALNEIVVRDRVTQASQVLDKLRTYVINALGQNNPEHQHKDGLDIGLCIYNSNSRVLQFAGAHIHLWLLRKTDANITLENGKYSDNITGNGYILSEIKGDIMPVGISPKLEPFCNITISLNSTNVILYMATDGYSDQLGGENMSKFGTQRLKSLIIENAHQEFQTQKENLNSTFDLWKGNNYQIDDVTILGINL